MNTATEPTFNIEHYQTVIDVSSDSEVDEPPTKRARRGMQLLIKTLEGKTITIDDVSEAVSYTHLTLPTILRV